MLVVVNLLPWVDAYHRDSLSEPMTYHVRSWHIKYYP